MITPGQRHEATQFERVMGEVRLRDQRGRMRSRHVAQAGDKAHSYPRIRRWRARHGVRAVIPRRSAQRRGDRRERFDVEAYRRRSVVEQFVGWLVRSLLVAPRDNEGYLGSVRDAVPGSRIQGERLVI
ncbi:hypothetical protein EP7_001922 [Isosphaeraceae bacterium EP7]